MKKIIGISGLARAGKNLFCNILTKQIVDKYNIKVIQMALADELKKDCEDFIKTKIELNVWSNKTEEKSIFRSILVEYGLIKRTQTEGRYWTEKLTKQIKECAADVIMVSDIRYALYPKDEVYWLKSEMLGHLVHIRKYEVDDEGNIFYNQPPNEQERINDPIVRESADYKIDWKAVGGDINNEYLNSIVSTFVNSWLPEFYKK